MSGKPPRLARPPGAIAPATQPADPPPLFSHTSFCAMAGREARHLAELVQDADLTRRLPWSRQWRLEDLVHHVGAIHRWVASLVHSDARRYQPIRDTDDWPTPNSSRQAARWLVVGQGPLLAALEAADPGPKMWTWGADKHVRFSSRRMTHETGIHRADAELALDLNPQFDPQVAADGVNEFLENLWSARAWRRGMAALRGCGETIELISTDTNDRWIITRTSSGFTWTHRPLSHTDRSDVTVTGSVNDLYLLAWKRIHPDNSSLKVLGNQAVIDHWHRHSSV